MPSRSTADSVDAEVMHGSEANRVRAAAPSNRGTIIGPDIMIVQRPPPREFAERAA